VLALLQCLAFVAAAQAAAIVAVDDAGRELRLEQAPTRIVTLAPSLTELVFAAGAGAAIVAADSSSDFPAAVRTIPRIGDAARIDVERLLALKPDLVIVWRHGNTTRELDQLEAAGVRLFSLEPQRLADVVNAIERLGQLLGTEDTARPAAAALRDTLATLRNRHANAATVRVFYQVWASPLMTINRRQIVSEVIELCGGRNVFGAVATRRYPIVKEAEIVAAAPEVILLPDEPYAFGAEHAAALRALPVPAAAAGRIHCIDGTLLSWYGPRIRRAIELLRSLLSNQERPRGSIA
jgi:iron complex transport system substrate-binding protein